VTLVTPSQGRSQNDGDDEEKRFKGQLRVM
jgi:hypothetical protein